MLTRIIAILVIGVLLIYPYIISTTDVLHEIDKISYTLIYDPEDNLGMVILKVYMNQVDDYEEISLPINIFVSENATYDFLHYTASPSLEVLPSYGNNTDILSFVVRGSGGIEFVFSAKDLMEEAGIGVYVLFIDSSSYKDIITPSSFSLEIHILGKYNVFVGEMTKDILYKVVRNSTMSSVFINGIGTLIAVFSLEIPLENITITPVLSTTVTTFSPTPGITSTSITTTSPQYPTQTLTQSPLSLTISPPTIALIAVGIAIVIVLVIFIIRRSRYMPEIETGDITTDPVARSIIKILGDSGQTELLQSEIVNKTGLPKSSVSRRVRRLEEEGYIVVKRSGKYNYISLTDKGRGLYKKITGDRKS